MVIGSPTFAAELHSTGFTAALANNGANAQDYGGDTKCTGVLSDQSKRRRLLKMQAEVKFVNAVTAGDSIQFLPVV